MSDDDKIVNFTDRLVDREHAQWERERDRLKGAMLETDEALDEGIGGLATVTLRALLDIMMDGGMTIDDATTLLSDKIDLFRKITKLKGGK